MIHWIYHDDVFYNLDLVPKIKKGSDDLTIVLCALDQNKSDCSLKFKTIEERDLFYYKIVYRLI